MYGDYASYESFAIDQGEERGRNPARTTGSRREADPTEVSESKDARIQIRLPGELGIIFR